MKMRLIMMISVAVAMAGLVSGTVSAHVVVKPAEALTGAYQTFTAAVPNEKEVPVTQIKLLVPDNVQSVTPTVKPGWQIAVEKEGQGESAKVKSITWSGGSIPAGQRDDFGFSAKTPDTAADIQWKAYQTYQDGTVVAWDQAPDAADGHGGSGNSGPYSVTKVSGDTAASEYGSTTSHGTATSTSDSQARLLAVIALAVSIAAFASAGRKKK